MALDWYRARVSVHKKGHAQENYRLAQLAKSKLAPIALRQLRSSDIAAYRDQRLASVNPKTGKPLSAATVRLDLSLLSHLFDIARTEWGLCEHNPVKQIRKPKIPAGRDRRLTAREYRQILRYAHNYPNLDLYSIIVLAIETAMRQGEILGLAWENLQLKNRIAHLPDTKNGSKRDVPLSAAAREAILRMQPKATGPVFTYTTHGLKSVWRSMMTRLGIEDLHFHDLRHEATSRLFELGTMDAIEIAAITGHKSMSMLKRYTHLKAQHLVRKLDGGRNRKRQALLDIFVPYPGVLTTSDNGFTVRMPDFGELRASGATAEKAMIRAQDVLMRAIVMTCLKDGFSRLPEPDQFLDMVDPATVFMIDPLAMDASGDRLAEDKVFEKGL